MLPTETWAAIFRYIRPSKRIHFMWSIATHFPTFAYIFSREPQLWMDWPIMVGGSGAQRCEVLYAITLWCELQRTGRSIPISVHAVDSGIVALSDLVSLLPLQCLPHIHGLSLRTNRDSYIHYDISTLLSYMSGLRHLTLSIAGKCRGPFGSGPVVFPHHPSMRLRDASLTSLCFHNIIVVPMRFLDNQWAHLTALHLAYYREVTTTMSSLYNLLFAASNIVELHVHVASNLPSMSHGIFEVPLNTRHATWAPRLEVVSLRGTRLHISAFVNSLLAHPRVSLRSIHLTYNCDVGAIDKFFVEIPAFLTAMCHWSGVAAVHANKMSVYLGGNHSMTGVKKWFVRWKFYDKWDPTWVSRSVYIYQRTHAC